MFSMIDEMDEMPVSLEKESQNISGQVNKLLAITEPGMPYSANEFMSELGIKTKNLKSCLPESGQRELSCQYDVAG